MDSVTLGDVMPTIAPSGLWFEFQNALLIVFVFLMGLFIGELGYVHNRSRWFNVMSTWTTLNITHRGEVMTLQSLSTLMGVPLQFVSEADSLAIATATASVSALVWHKRSTLLALL